MFGFAVLSALIHLIPNAIALVDSIFNVFGSSFYIAFVSNIIDVIDDVIGITEKL